MPLFSWQFLVRGATPENYENFATKKRCTKAAFVIVDLKIPEIYRIILSYKPGYSKTRINSRW